MASRTDTTTMPSRRGLLTALAAAPIAIGAIVAPTIPSQAAAADQSAWDRGMATYLKARNATQAHDANVYRPAAARLDALATRPPLQFTVEAKNGQRATYDLWPANLHHYDDAGPQIREAAAAERERWLTYKRHSEATGHDAAADEWDRLSEVESDARSILIVMPAPDLKALGWKMEELFGDKARDDDRASPAWRAEYINAVMADVRRLLGTEA